MRARHPRRPAARHHRRALLGLATPPGDIVPLARLLDPAWRFPARLSPIAWVDRAGLVWLDNDLAVLIGNDGDMPPRLAQLFQQLISGRRRLPGHPGPFEPVRWSVAIVDTHH